MIERPDWDLLERYLARACAPDEAARVDRWVRASERHAALLEALRRALAGDDDLAPVEPDVARAWARLERDMHCAAPRITVRQSPRSARWLSTARPPPASASTLFSLAAAAILVVAGASALLWRSDALWQRQQPVTPLREVATANAQSAAIRLPDGSRVMLAAASRLRFSQAFDRTVTREVHMEGEAFFEVARDSARPFLVHAAHAVTEVLGTSFVVRAYEGDSSVRVVVATGRVALRPAGDSSARVLAPGELGRVRADGSMEVEQVEPGAFVSWTEGRLEFDDTPLAEVARSLSRWYDIDVVLADASLAARRFTGAFHEESVGEVFDALTPPLHARYELRADGSGGGGRRVVVLHALAESQ